jgi:hypothetical protein
MSMRGLARSAGAQVTKVRNHGPGRPKGELCGLRNAGGDTMRGGVGRHPRSQTRPSGLGFALLARASLGGCGGRS